MLIEARALSRENNHGLSTGVSRFQRELVNNQAGCSFLKAQSAFSGNYSLLHPSSASLDNLVLFKKPEVQQLVSAQV